MRAGYSRIDITPPTGTPLMGYSDPYKRVSTGVNDPLYLRVAYFEHDGKKVAICSVDFCFIGRDEAERMSGVVARDLGLRPDQFIIAATHTHAAPASGTYVQLEFGPPLRDYNRRLRASLITAIKEAIASAQPVRIKAAAGKSDIGMNRRKKLDNGTFVNGPNPAGPWHDSLPVAVFESIETSKPVVCLFSASAHPVTMNKSLVSADYPGVACDELDKHFGAPCAIFLQGCGGDSRPKALSAGQTWNWDCNFSHAQTIGKQLARETISLLPSLAPVEPLIATALIDTQWPMVPHASIDEYRQWSTVTNDSGLKTEHAQWAARWLHQLEHKQPLPANVSVLLHGIQLGHGLRLAVLEGEPLTPHGRAMEAFFAPAGGVTFALGYAGGESIYIPDSRQLAEGGYESTSYWEYGWPAALAPGMEKVLHQGLLELRAMGVN
jgi:neutral ceramidase